MKLRPSLALILMFLLLASLKLQAQNPQPAQQPTSDDDEVVRITTNLVQIDPIVTDKNGQQVTDLKPEEFEIQEDGRPQQITHFSYVSIATNAQPDARPSPRDYTPSYTPPVRLKPEQVRRTLALVIDDLGLSFESTTRVRASLKKFVDEQMQAGDLVAIIRTSAGVGALQQFTSDKRQLYAAIERVRWYPFGRTGISAFAPIARDIRGAYANELGQLGNTSSDESKGAALMGRSKDASEEQGVEENTMREELFTVGTLGALNYIVRGLRDLPGRKSVVLFSDGIRIFERIKQSNRRDSGDDANPGIKVKGTPSTVLNTRILDSLHRLTDLANRASVVIYTMDARGLQTLGLTAEDNTLDKTPAQLEQAFLDRRDDYFDTQSGLIYLSRLTGGLAIRDSNDLNKGLNRVLDDQKGYYLIGYRPDEATFDPQTGRRKFHNLTIKVKRPGLRVRFRSGFYGVSDEADASLARRAPEDQLFTALASPFGAGGVHLRLTSLFGNDEIAGSFMYAMLHIDGRDLTFTQEPDGSHSATIDVVALTYGDDGNVIDRLLRTHKISAQGDDYKSVEQNGLVYSINIPVKKPGAYQLRIAVRDAASKRVGSASQFIEVPNLSNEHLTLSGLVLNGNDLSKNAKSSLAGNALQGMSDVTDPQASPAVRRLRPGMDLHYSYHIYNSKIDAATKKPALKTQVVLYRDGQRVYVGKLTPFEVDQQADGRRYRAGGHVKLSANAAPGEYVLQVIVMDALAKNPYSIATQWIDFEIVK